MAEISHFDIILKIKSLLPKDHIFNIKHSLINNRNFFNISWENGITINELKNIIQSISYDGKFNSNYVIMSRNTIDINDMISKKFKLNDQINSNEFLRDFSFKSNNISDVEIEWTDDYIIGEISDMCIIRYIDSEGKKHISRKNKINTEKVESKEKLIETEDFKSKKIEIIHYTEKSIVVIGDTKDIKDKLKTLGGSWNAKLTNKETLEIFGGWIFPKSKEDTLRKDLKKYL
jgi:hypothetical protein